MKVLIKAMRPHRQKVLTEDGQEMRLQQWANKTASAALRGAGREAGGEQFTQARDALMREAVANPDEHGLKFMGERMPFDGQELEESLSEPDYGNSPEEQKVFEHLMSLNPEEQEVLSNNRTPDIFDEEGKLRQTLPQGEEEKEEFDPDAEAEHLRRIMTSRDVAIRDAWTVLKQDLSFMTEEERRQYELGQKLDALRRHGGLPQKSPVPSRGFPSAAGNA